MTKQSIEYRFFKKFAPQIKDIIVPPDAVGEFGWEGYFDIKPQDGIDFIKQEITKALQFYSQEMDKINEVMWIEKEKDKTGHDVGWNSALAEHEARKLKIDKKWRIK